MTKKWLWLIIGVVVAVGLILQAGCVPSTSRYPEEEKAAAAPLPEEKEVPAATPVATE